MINLVLLNILFDLPGGLISSGRSAMQKISSLAPPFSLLFSPFWLLVVQAQS